MTTSQTLPISPQPFDIRAALPTGTTVLEASAGTGKTYAIVGVAARHIAEGTPISRLLLVTFSRSATAELRERTRLRVAELVAALAHPDGPHDTGDELLSLLLRGTTAEIATRRSNLVKALSDFDASTIATTHTFCNRMLDALGFLGERELIYDIVEDANELVEEASADIYLAGFAGRTDPPPFTLEQAVKLAKEAVAQPSAVLAPAAGDKAAEWRVAFCTRVRTETERRKRLSRLRTYDDLQSILYGIVTDPVVGEQACERIRSAFSVVLVDEFQDTDPQQWEIVRRCFHGHGKLVLVGDPKQAIYAFRGAEVLSYLQAVRSADALLALGTNWRSDRPLVDALFRLYGGASLGHPDIVVHQVDSAHATSRVRGTVPLRLRAFVRRDFTTTAATTGLPYVSDVRQAVIEDVAIDIARLLSSDAEIDTGDDFRPVAPGDIAVLVRKHDTVAPLQQALARLGVASVVGAGGDVFKTPAARHWLGVITAIEQPAQTRRVTMAAMTPLVGWSPSRVADAGETEIAGLAADLARLGRVFDQGGFAALGQRLLAENEVAARLLAADDGERKLTDVLQIASLCNRHVVDTSCGLAGLAEWLADRISDSSRRTRHDAQTRRLDRDTAAVQIMTVHASKGLQFPIVYVPFGWDVVGAVEPDTFAFHDAAGVRHLDVGGASPGRGERLATFRTEEAGEDLRLLYVALTRARSAVVAWWAPMARTARSPLHRLLFGRTPGAAMVPETVDIPDDQRCVTTLRALADGDPSITVEPAGRDAAEVWQGGASHAADTELGVATFTSVIDQTWRRTSYSAIIAHAGHAHPVIETGSEPEVSGIDDEPPEEPDTDSAEEIGGARPGTPSLMNGLPFGAAFGTLVHEVLEYVDTAHPDITAHVAELCGRAAAHGMTDVDTEVLTRALVGVLTTPLGFGDLWRISPGDRLAELDFELPLAGPDDGVVLTELAELMEDHLPDDDPLRPYAGILRELSGPKLRGFLTGSIDSVLRTDEGQFVIVDYKTNRLRPGDLVAEDFSTAAMAGEMISAHYPLQALLYSVALHRYLRWRLPGYRAQEHLGPVQYHFVRGMIGPDTPPGCGVFEWAVPPTLVSAMSDLLAGGVR
ncbi:UvrD-helicase domain-containing protein [Gordonia sp. CPCC 205515]|uniref:UvrD-helicase domain-containing protein n=1 Tax=Gordonia sp. CPCC 205515 TaxID=3140791 RepID=UPI003AF36B4C